MKTKVDYEVMDKLTEDEANTLMYYVYAVAKAKIDLENYKTTLLTNYNAKDIFEDLSKLFDFGDLQKYAFDAVKESIKEDGERTEG